MGASFGSSSTSTSTTSAPPSWVTGAYLNTLNRAVKQSKNPYEAYTGQLTAGLSDAQSHAISGLGNAQGAFQPYFDQASEYGQQGTTALTPMEFSADAIAKYQNPYTSQVVDATLADLAKLFGTQQNQVTGNAITSGAWGGDRAGIVKSNLAGQQAQTAATTLAGLRSAAYNNALGQFNTENQTQLAAQQQNNANALQAAGLFQGLGTGAATNEINLNNALLNAGGVQQQTEQRGLDAQYQQFLNEQQYPFQVLSWLTGIATGIGSNAGGTSNSESSTDGWSAGLSWKADGGRVNDREPYASGGLLPYGTEKQGGLALPIQNPTMGQGPPRAQASKSAPPALPQSKGQSEKEQEQLKSGIQGIMNMFSGDQAGAPQAGLSAPPSAPMVAPDSSSLAGLSGIPSLAGLFMPTMADGGKVNDWDMPSFDALWPVKDESRIMPSTNAPRPVIVDEVVEEPEPAAAVAGLAPLPPERPKNLGRGASQPVAGLRPPMRDDSDEPDLPAAARPVQGAPVAGLGQPPGDSGRSLQAAIAAGTLGLLSTGSIGQAFGIGAQTYQDMENRRMGIVTPEQRWAQLQAEKLEADIARVRADASKMDLREVNGRLLRVNPRTGEVTDITPSGMPERPGEYSLSPVWGVDDAGNPTIIQLGKDGRPIQPTLPPGVKIARDPIKVDAGTNFVLVDPQTRQPVATVPKDLKGAEKQKVLGKEEGQALAALPSTLAAADSMLKTISNVENDSSLGWGTGALSRITTAIPGTPTFDFGQKVAQIKGQAFLEAFNTLRGGGQITETEGQKATDAIGRLNTSQTEEGFRTALKELREVVEAGKKRAMQKAGAGGVSETAAPNAPATPAAQGPNTVQVGARVKQGGKTYEKQPDGSFKEVQ